MNNKKLDPVTMGVEEEGKVVLLLSLSNKAKIIIILYVRGLNI